MNPRMIWIVALAVSLVPVSAQADVPPLMNYQGKLTDELGDTVPDSTYLIEFRIYTDPVGGDLLWSEQQLVSVKKGLFSVMLGDSGPIPDSVFTGPVRWLALQLSSDPELTPRQPMVSVGYAFRACHADTADYALSAAPDDDWVIAGDDLYRLTGSVGIGTASPEEQLDVAGAIKIGTSSTTNSGTIRWTGSDFEGYTGTEWKSLTAGSVDTSNLSILQTVEHSYDNNWSVEVDLTDHVDCSLIFVGHGRVNYHTTFPLKLQVWDGSNYVDASWGDGYFVPGSKNREWCFQIYFRFRRPRDQSGSTNILASWTGTYTGFASYDYTFDTGQYGALWTKTGPDPLEWKIKISAAMQSEIHFHIVRAGESL